MRSRCRSNQMLYAARLLITCFAPTLLCSCRKTYVPPIPSRPITEQFVERAYPLPPLSRLGSPDAVPTGPRPREATIRKLGPPGARSYVDYSQYIRQWAKGAIVDEQQVEDDIYFTYEYVHAVGYDTRLPPGTISIQQLKEDAWTRVPEEEYRHTGHDDAGR